MRIATFDQIYIIFNILNIFMFYQFDYFHWYQIFSLHKLHVKTKQTAVEYFTHWSCSGTNFSSLPKQPFSRHLFKQTVTEINRNYSYFFESCSSFLWNEIRPFMHSRTKLSLFNFWGILDKILSAGLNICLKIFFSCCIQTLWNSICTSCQRETLMATEPRKTTENIPPISQTGEGHWEEQCVC